MTPIVGNPPQRGFTLNCVGHAEKWDKLDLNGRLPRAGLDRQPGRDLTLGSVRGCVSCVWKVKMEIPVESWNQNGNSLIPIKIGLAASP
jgi:hypothetical protein